MPPGETKDELIDRLTKATVLKLLDLSYEYAPQVADCPDEHAMVLTRLLIGNVLDVVLEGMAKIEVEARG